MQVALDDTGSLGPNGPAWRKEGDSYVVTWPGRDLAFAVDAIALDAIRMLCQGVAVREVHETIRARSGEEYDVASLASMLTEAGILGAAAAPMARERRSAPAWVVPAYFTLAALGGVVGLLVILADPGILPGLRYLRTEIDGIAWGLQIGILTATSVAILHELGHWGVARAYGQPGRIRLGFQYAFPVLRTIVPGLWSVTPARRIAFFLGGMAMNVLILASVLVMKSTAAAGIASGDARIAALDIAAWVCIWQLVWQCFVAMRTDIYYVVATLAARWDLHEEIAARFRRTPRGVPRPAWRPRDRVGQLYLVNLVVTWVVILPLVAYSLTIFAWTSIPLLFGELRVSVGDADVLGAASDGFALLFLGTLSLGGLYSLATSVATGLRAWWTTPQENAQRPSG